MIYDAGYVFLACNRLLRVLPPPDMRCPLGRLRLCFLAVSAVKRSEAPGYV